MRKSSLLLSYRVQVCAIICVVLVGHARSFAALGEDVSSIDADRVHLNASVRVMPAQRYAIHELQTPAGTTIRQFVSPAGRVFAVTWHGFSPDLRQLLGDHFDEYMAAASQVSHRGRGVHIETGDLVFDSGGHMRYVVGRAFLSSQLPSGVSTHELR